MKTLVQYLAVGGAGFFGAVLRLFVSSACGLFFGAGFPVGTLLINLSGSFLLGWFYTVISGRVVVSDAMKLAVAVGFIGAYTTFSTFTWETVELLKDGAVIKAVGNVVGSLVLGLLAVRLGIYVGNQ